MSKTNLFAGFYSIPLLHNKITFIFSVATDIQESVSVSFHIISFLYNKLLNTGKSFLEIFSSYPRHFECLFNNLSLVLIKGEEYGRNFINTKGEILCDQQFRRATDFKDGFADFEVDNKWGVIDTTGKIVIPPIYEKAVKLSMVKP